MIREEQELTLISSAFLPIQFFSLEKVKES